MSTVKPLKSKPKVTTTRTPSADGLRERKRRQTRERLTRVAIELFLARGFEATTLDDIAAAAEISRRSFFHYFASKEDVVLAWQDASTDALIAAIAERPADEPMLTAAENAILTMARQLKPDEAIALARLKRDTPALRAREQVKYEKMEQAMAAALGRRASDKAGQARARLVAMITTGAIRLASEAWLAQDAHEKPEALVRRTFKSIRAVLDEPPAHRSKN
ncbi:TetR/AcrR family transcriptional regulator [Rhodopseudomonas sp. P2A-2r]|uniref:TetR/AcrR family transcriptional regulator n=1 Tax=unclassified Rhodopseudomonas TaxID=2638247 RepID=UPI0022344EAE|nr:TetR/AcrR family transcriptional regulator [Rhodopseudomonas sp. P2A-2r]UZE49039.1 TetR/AcrR family transcriptional regulator [Rhodopseudomonas sp. P2A-2r]